MNVKKITICVPNININGMSFLCKTTCRLNYYTKKIMSFKSANVNSAENPPHIIQ